MKLSIKVQKIIKSFFLLYYLIYTPIIIRKNPKQIKKIQNKKLKKIIKKAYETELYRPKFDAAGITPEDIRSLDDLVKFPVLTKAEYRDHIAKKVKESPEEYEGWFKDHTSGSTGIPLEVWHTPFERAGMLAKAFKIYKHTGHKIFFNSIFAVVSPTHSTAEAHSFIRKLGLARKYEVSQLDETAVIVEKFNRVKPDLLTANVSHVVSMVKYAEENNITLFQPKIVITTAEKLTPPIYEMMKKHFGDNIIDCYGCIETGRMAYSLKGDINKHHFINEFNAFIVLNDQLQPSDNGNIYVTSLFQKGFPLINYQIGDSVETYIENSERRITKINGRSDDRIKYSNGTSVPFQHVYEVMSTIPYCAQFKVIQEDYKNLTFVLIKQVGVTVSNEDIEKIILKNAQRILPDKGLQYNFKWVNEIPIEKSGKIRMLISKVK